jgi:peptidoglycan/xylan/chitin deacetylase (PgdA/CDA1 family)
VLAPKTSAKLTTSHGSIWIPAFAGKVGAFVAFALAAAGSAQAAAQAGHRPDLRRPARPRSDTARRDPRRDRPGAARRLPQAKAPAFGFINGAGTLREPASTPALTLWRDAGQPLGNHTWSHPNIASLSAADFTAEIAGNEAMLRDADGR